MLEKLRQSPESIPSPSADEMMKMFNASWTRYAMKSINTGEKYDNHKF